MKVLIAHPGTQYSHQLVKQLDKHGLLYKFYTGFAIAEGSFAGFIFKLLPAFFTKKINNRFIESVNNNKLSTNPLLELKAIRKLNGNNSETVFFERNKKFQQLIPDKAILNSDVVIGFDTSSWLLAERCKYLKRSFILDVSIGHPNSKEKIYKELNCLYPQWGEQIQAKTEALIKIEYKEIELASAIVVPSEFVKKTYTDNGVDASKIFINPFGTDLEIFTTSKEKKEIVGKIKFLFFGALTARKGLPLLLEAWKHIDETKAELIIAGYGKIPEGIDLPSTVNNKGVINKEDRQSLFNSSHVFIFPSNFEGFAQVQIEAAACGLPIIGTFNSGATELIENGENGFVIPISDISALVNTIDYFIKNPDKIEVMGEANRRKALAFTWDAYGERWKKIIMNPN